MSMFQVQDKTLHYQLSAAVVPEDTLFIHGNLASNRWWQPTFNILTSRFKEQFVSGKLASAEWLGCGQSSAPKTLEELSLPSLAHHYVSLIRGLGLNDVHVVGHSTGGLIALLAVLEAPELFKKIVLLDSVGPRGIALAPEMLDAFARMQKDREFCRAVIASTIYEVDVNDKEFLALADETFENVAPLVWTGIPQVLAQMDITERLKTVDQPTLILHGELDPILPKDHPQSLKQCLPNSELMILNNQGHSCNLENPERFCELLIQFLYGGLVTV